MRPFRYSLYLFLTKAKIFFFIFSVVSFSISLTSLQYAEAIENDGLTICENTDLQSSSCENSQKDDNDNETVQVIVEIDASKKFQIIRRIPFPLAIPLPEYKKSYLFAFTSLPIKPPISSI